MWLGSWLVDLGECIVCALCKSSQKKLTQKLAALVWLGFWLTDFGGRIVCALCKSSQKKLTQKLEECVCV